MKKYMQIDDFKFSSYFTELTVLQLNNALQIVNAQFSGVYSLWTVLPPDEAQAKRELCINYLLAWKLMQMYPHQVQGIASTGGIPLASKKAGPIFIKYKSMVRQDDSILSMLSTNYFGLEALTMIQSAPECYMVY